MIEEEVTEEGEVIEEEEEEEDTEVEEEMEVEVIEVVSPRSNFLEGPWLAVHLHPIETRHLIK